MFDLAAGTLLGPTVLFFALGLVAAFIRSDLHIPAGAAKFLSLYLLLAIGFKGGHNLSAHGLAPEVFASLGGGLVLSFLMPFLAFGLARVMTRLNRVDAAAVAGHYGSISIVTFVAATSLLDQHGLSPGGHMVAVAAVMEVPAILSALWLAGGKGLPLRHILANGSVVLLTGAFVIGAVTGAKGMELMTPFIVTPFTGLLCLFLLDMGITAGTSLRGTRNFSPGLFAFGIVMPLAGACCGWAMGQGLGLAPENLFLLTVLAASASYIAVPAALRVALPQADPAVSLTLSLGMTFPFNLILGLPLYLWAAGLV